MVWHDVMWCDVTWNDATKFELSWFDLIYLTWSAACVSPPLTSSSRMRSNRPKKAAQWSGVLPSWQCVCVCVCCVCVWAWNLCALGCVCVCVCVCACVLCVCWVLRIDCVLSVTDCFYDEVNVNGCRRFRVNERINTSFKQTMRC
jgi:hypothetical protein